MDGKERRWKMIHGKKRTYVYCFQHTLLGGKVEIKASFAFKSEFLICFFFCFCPVLLHFSHYRLSNDTTTKTLKPGVGGVGGMGGGLASSTWTGH